jgi:Caspase domain
MDGQHTVVTHYAILIGIDAYHNRPLKGCVRDVQNIKRYLEGVPYPVHIQMFTATESADLESSSPTGDSILWPTYHNVTSTLEKVASLAKAGDFVYIHYSGHGTRATPCSEFSNKSTGDLALVLLNGTKENPVSYLWGPRLALSLKAMVAKGLVVTLVLDCCFSATVYRRDDPDVRFVPYDHEIDSKFPLNAEKSLKSEAGGSTSREASMLPNWLINPDGYAILTACGPHEEAIELKFDGQRHGALSYLLLRILECGGPVEKHKDIYDRLRAEFRKYKLRQNPVFYGNKDQVFFGGTNFEITAATVPIIEKDGSLELLAGQAHGVSDGDQFALYPLSSAEPTSQRESVVAKVAHARALTSNLERLDRTSIRVRTGWMARVLTRFSLRRFPIRLASDLPHRDELLTALKERSLDVHIDMGQHPFTFHVVLNSNKEYEALDESGQKINNLPTMTQGQTDINSICDIIEHLAKFRLVKDLANKILEDPFQDSFDVRIINHDERFHPGCLMEVEHGDKLELVVENRGDKELYLYIYDMGPCWQIENILRGSYEVIPLQKNGKGFTGLSKKKLQMMVPPEMREKGQRQCEDIIKVFVTSKPASFDLLELQKLGESAKWKPTSRTGREYRDSSEEWAALNFPIRTSLE